ncbi:MAG: hypothetical protein ACKOKE_05680, partial [Actinomycetota bacterium]
GGRGGVAGAAAPPLPGLTRRELRPTDDGGWVGPAGAEGTAYLSIQDAEGWRGPAGEGTRAFGWAATFAAPEGAVAIAPGASLLRLGALVLLVGLWVSALWVTRRPVSA